MRPSVTSEQRRSRNELSVLQHVMLLLRRDSMDCAGIAGLPLDSKRIFYFVQYFTDLT